MASVFSADAKDAVLKVFGVNDAVEVLIDPLKKLFLVGTGSVVLGTWVAGLGA